MTISLAQECPLERPVDAPSWSENFALVFADPASGASALYSIGTWYRDTSVWRENLAVALPDGRIAVARGFGRNSRGAVVSASLSRYEIRTPDRAVSLTYDGPATCHTFQEMMQSGVLGGKTHRLRLHLDFEACAPTWDMHEAHQSDPTGIAGAMHIEQLGRVSGSVRLDGDELAIRDAVSCRDHSRGRRDVSLFRNHCWINGVFPGGKGFQLYFFRIHGNDGPALSLATVIAEGSHHRASIERIELADGPDDFGGEHSVVLKSALGEMRIDIRQVLATIPLHMSAPFDPAFGIGRGSYGLLFDEPVRMHCNGETGFGWCERGFSKHRIR